MWATLGTHMASPSRGGHHHWAIFLSSYVQDPSHLSWSDGHYVLLDFLEMFETWVICTILSHSISPHCSAVNFFYTEKRKRRSEDSERYSSSANRVQCTLRICPGFWRVFCADRAKFSFTYKISHSHERWLLVIHDDEFSVSHRCWEVWGEFLSLPVTWDIWEWLSSSCFLYLSFKRVQVIKLGQFLICVESAFPNFYHQHLALTHF